ncbi:peptidoglycan-binding protein [Streptomyces sp. BB1-1-1]|uniref:peptidoglycan-binding protein n=1 Tax=Streptomyces sp. BB1-1-1 TaxID=3074430 RepID=UPI002877FE3F|nr:peptidoglycan-binding protein [Streptomyces sp. BB1-1-1]WND36912.1 peptidoglycan-binding protein [Streptomyces sp. BB1-1-1]
MARMPGAKWRPIPVNHTNGGQESVRGVVVHIMAGSYNGTDSWFRNPAAQASSHFGTSKAGALCQWVDTADRAWAQADGNRDWLSVENEGQGGDTLTDDQLDRNAEVLAWAHEKYGVPLKVADGPGDRGLGYHAMGGRPWGNHPSCPGSRIVKQLPTIVDRAKKIAGTGGTSGTAPAGVARYTVTINGLTYGYGAHGDHVTRVGKALVARGYGKHYAVGPGPEWTDSDTRNYSDFQKSLGYKGADADGVPGASSLRALLGALPNKATPTVDLSKLVNAAKVDPPKRGTPVSYAGARTVEAALAAEDLLDEQYVDGHFGTATKTAYAAWQRRCGYSGRDADGIPGRSSLAALGKRHGFRVVA